MPTLEAMQAELKKIEVQQQDCMRRRSDLRNEAVSIQKSYDAKAAEVQAMKMIDGLSDVEREKLAQAIKASS